MSSDNGNGGWNIPALQQRVLVPLPAQQVEVPGMRSLAIGPGSVTVKLPADAVVLLPDDIADHLVRDGNADEIAVRLARGDVIATVRTDLSWLEPIMSESVERGVAIGKALTAEEIERREMEWRENPPVVQVVMPEGSVQVTNIVEPAPVEIVQNDAPRHVTIQRDAQGRMRGAEVVSE